MKQQYIQSNFQDSKKGDTSARDFDLSSAYSGPIDPPIPIWSDPPVPESLTPQMWKTFRSY